MSKALESRLDSDESDVYGERVNEWRWQGNARMHLFGVFLFEIGIALPSGMRFGFTR